MLPLRLWWQYLSLPVEFNFKCKWFLFKIDNLFFLLFYFFCSISFDYTSRIMQITFLRSALRGASVSSLFEATGSKSAPIHWETRPSLLAEKQSAVLFWVWPTMRFLCALLYISVCMHAHKPPPLFCHVDDNLALGNKYFWKTKCRQPNKKIFLQWEAFYPTSYVFHYFILPILLN